VLVRPPQRELGGGAAGGGGAARDAGAGAGYQLRPRRHAAPRLALPSRRPLRLVAPRRRLLLRHTPQRQRSVPILFPPRTFLNLLDSISSSGLVLGEEMECAFSPLTDGFDDPVSLPLWWPLCLMVEC
jgi:hypothetical protein